REVVILLDPPGMAAAAPAAAPAPVMPTKAASPAAAPPAAPVAAPPAAGTGTTPPAAAVTGSEAVPNGKLGPVQHGQTLSGIAHRTAPAGTDMNQMLLALKQANPDAFYRDNINALKSGVVLRVPTSAEVKALTAAAALAEVRRQNSDWRARTTVRPTTVADAATRAGASSSPTGSSGNSTDRLALVPPKEGSGAGANGGAAARKNAKALASMNQDLLRAKESLASLQQQGVDLKTRIKDLADINSKNERLLSLKDNEIAALQSKLAEARKAAKTPVSPPSVSEVKPAPSASVAEKPASVAAGATVAAPATTATVTAASSAPAAASTAMAQAPVAAASAPAAPASKEVKPAAKPVVAARAAVAAEQPWYMQLWAQAAVGAAVLLLLLLVMRSRKSKAATGSASSSLADRFAASSAATTAEDDADQDEILEQLAEHPDDIYLHLELVTLYYSRRDEERFEAAAEAMYAHVTDPQQDEWQDVVHMGEDLVPGHPLFSPHGDEPAQQETHDQQTFDIDDFAADDDMSMPAAATSSMPPAAPASKKVSEYHYDFDLTAQRPQASESDNTVFAPVAAATHAQATHDVTSSDWPVSEPVPEGPGEEAQADGVLGDESLLGAGDYSDDPADTKLDLARAYLDMGDAEGARAMLGEVLKEGTPLQQETASQLLENLR
ncbi:MAG: fimbrial protein FimV, partial [Rhodanobacter sp.]|nr:fimbrial protein FimV [Rhodanobacter sp.]